MNCGDPRCTGFHNNRQLGKKCPAAVEADRVKARERMRVLRADPTYRRRSYDRLNQQRRESEAYRQKRREVYANLNGYRYNLLLLKHRRQKALAKMRQRHTAEEV